jgi:hypothetical protein
MKIIKKLKMKSKIRFKNNLFKNIFYSQWFRNSVMIEWFTSILNTSPVRQEITHVCIFLFLNNEIILAAVWEDETLR